MAAPTRKFANSAPVEPTVVPVPVISPELKAAIHTKITVQNYARVDIRSVGKDRYRVNVWAETGDQSEGGFFTEKRIAQSFFHTSA